MEIKNAIKKIRISKGYSQQQIADILITTQQQYSKYETGAQEIPVRHIVTLCKIYGVTANKLIGIDIFMTEEEAKTKFERLYDQTMEILSWAEYQGHIKENQRELLENEITETKEEIEND